MGRDGARLRGVDRPIVRGMAYGIGPIPDMGANAL